MEKKGEGKLAWVGWRSRDCTGLTLDEEKWEEGYV